MVHCVLAALAALTVAAAVVGGPGQASPAGAPPPEPVVKYYDPLP